MKYLLHKLNVYRFNKKLDGSIFLKVGKLKEAQNRLIQTPAGQFDQKVFYKYWVEITNPDWALSIHVPFYPYFNSFNDINELDKIKEFLLTAKCKNIEQTYPIHSRYN